MYRKGQPPMPVTVPWGPLKTFDASDHRDRPVRRRTHRSLCRPSSFRLIRVSDSESENFKAHNFDELNEREKRSFVQEIWNFGAINFEPLDKAMLSLLVRFYDLAVVVALLAERSLSITEVCSSNPVIHQILKRTYLLLIVEKMKIKKKRLGNDP